MDRLAIFDMDCTITRRATFTGFLVFAAKWRAPWRLALLPLVGLVALGHPLKLVDRKRIKEIGFRLIIGPRISEADLQAASAAFAKRTLAENCYPEAVKQVERERDAGATLILATASPDFYAEAIGKLLGFDHVIATRQLRDGSDYAWRIDGNNCYAATKLDRVKGWIAEHAIDRSQSFISFYSDHVSDAVVHEWSDEPYAVNAHPPLRALAKERGWTILDFS